MNIKSELSKRFGIGLGVGLLLAAITSPAQFAPGASPGASSSSSRSSSRSGSSTTSYPSSTDIGQARITYDAETRSVIVVADEETAQYITNVLSQLDHPAPQVLIKCVFMEATYSKGSDIGVKGIYKHTISGNGIDAINSPPATPGVDPRSTASTLFDLAATGGTYSLIGKDVQITLSALANAGKTEILSRPSILARNNQQATITIGQQVPLISGVTYDDFGNQHNAITYQNVGIILQVTPFISSEGMVEMIRAPQISSLSDSSVTFASGSSTNTIAGAPSAPIINIRSADTVVVVPDGQTVVIGGLMQNQKVTTEEKVPLLGDIPLLGLLFKHKVTDNEKKELLIFMTPHIVNRPTELAARSRTERNDTEISGKGFTEEELNRFLDGLPPGENKPALPLKKQK